MPERHLNTPGPFDGLTFEEKQALYDTLSELYSDNKRQLFDRLVLNRTRHFAVVLEEIFQSHNASAVLRSCDCFGVQDVHVIEERNRYQPNPEVAMGSNKWVDWYKHPSITDAYDHLHRHGYQVIATLPHEKDTLIGDLDISRPTALVFGTELTGLSDEAIAHADGYVKIPMYGFTESFNISVCAALSLFSLTERMRKDPAIHWQLSPEEQTTLKLYWSLQVIKDGERVLQEIMDRRR
ncbi:MAG: RNA methyltransferase [Bacteroidales bacterium]|nr:RNA methyltransferase [Bacteroidales bacterium]